MKLNLSSLTARIHHTEGGGVNPERDWDILLVGSIVLFVLIVGWHVWAFSTVVSDGTLGNAGQSAPPPQHASVLDTIPAFLTQRAAEDANYINGTYRFADPSQ